MKSKSIKDKKRKRGAKVKEEDRDIYEEGIYYIDNNIKSNFKIIIHF